ncbi:MAG TPA: SRPBCC domain-containing protein [Gemmatimonadaceae bacterium]|nr:SRPBCC domain-containing protein [Gemmatimonadaceae bacterium]
MRLIKRLGLTVIAILAVVFIVGYRLPEQHTATRDRVFSATPERIFKEISTPTAYPKWRSGVQGVQILPDSDGMQRFREAAMTGEVTYIVEHTVPNRQFVLTIADANLPYTGSWTFDLVPVAGGTQLTITEDGAVHNPMFRFMSRFVYGHFRTIDGYLADLDKRLTNTLPDS